MPYKLIRCRVKAEKVLGKNRRVGTFKFLDGDIIFSCGEGKRLHSGEKNGVLWRNFQNKFEYSGKFFVGAIQKLISADRYLIHEGN